jgi:prolipoprotein diacylglyceryltransferase
LKFDSDAESFLFLSEWLSFLTVRNVQKFAKFYPTIAAIKKDRPLYYDIITPSFLIAAIVGYIGTYFGGQIYGVPYDGIFSLTYDSKESTVPFRNALFPLPFLYVLCLALILGYLFKISKK